MRLLSENGQHTTLYYLLIVGIIIGARVSLISFQLFGENSMYILMWKCFFLKFESLLIGPIKSCLCEDVHLMSKLTNYQFTQVLPTDC